MSGIVSVRKALELALQNMPGNIATAWENTKYTPVAGTPYQVVTLMLAEPLKLEWGNSYSEIGYMQVQLRYPIEAGTAASFTQAQAIRDYFRNKLNLSADGVNVVINRAPTIGNGFVDGDRYAVTCKIRFFSNNTG